MSKQLLSNLNGNNTGLLYQFLNDFVGEPRIAWYPSAGPDFRPLHFLHPNDRKFYTATASKQEPPYPDLFLFTDYWAGWSNFLKEFINAKIGAKTQENQLRYQTIGGLDVEDMEELPRLNLLPLHKEIVHCPEGDELTDRVFFLKLRSKQRDSFFSYLLYAFAENEMFYCKKLVPCDSIISHIIHICYGGGRSGGSGFGIWLLNVLTQLKCELYITDESPDERSKYYTQDKWMSGDKYAFQFCGVPKTCDARLTLINSPSFFRGIWYEVAQVPILEQELKNLKIKFMSKFFGIHKSSTTILIEEIASPDDYERFSYGIEIQYVRDYNGNGDFLTKIFTQEKFIDIVSGKWKINPLVSCSFGWPVGCAAIDVTDKNGRKIQCHTTIDYHYRFISKRERDYTEGIRNIFRFFDSLNRDYLNAEHYLLHDKIVKTLQEWEYDDDVILTPKEYSEAENKLMEIKREFDQLRVNSKNNANELRVVNNLKDTLLKELQAKYNRFISKKQ